jgi:DNA-binding HxlR family transcriptional regulator
MTSQDILTELRSLKSDLNVYTDHIIQLRYEDLKASFLRQMRMAVGEEGRRSFQNDALTLKENSICPHRAECWTMLEEAVENASNQFKKDDFEAAERILDEVENMVHGECAPCKDNACSNRATETLRKIRTVLQVYENLAGMLEIEERAPKATSINGGEPSPDEAESVLDPLANAWRIKVLKALRNGDCSLSELGRRLDLRTGHLQFHLRGLVEAEFVVLDRRRHRYSITERGAVALGCTEEMVKKVMAVPNTRAEDILQ